MTDDVKMPVRKLLPNQDYFQPMASSFYGRISVVLPQGWTLDDALKPEFWSHVVTHLRERRIGTIIEVRNVEATLYAELFIRAVRDRDILVELLTDSAGKKRLFEFGPKETETSGYELRWNVGARGYDIIRKSDRVVVAAGKQFPTKELAFDWLSKIEPGRKAA